MWGILDEVCKSRDSGIRHAAKPIKVRYANRPTSNASVAFYVEFFATRLRWYYTVFGVTPNFCAISLPVRSSAISKRSELWRLVKKFLAIDGHFGAC